jgi:hypothetical protein
LEFWVHLDAAKSITACEWCGREFSVLTQLRDRDWVYRRSGLFGRRDDLGGGIPVALALQQLDTVLHGLDSLVYVTGTEIEPGSAAIEKCESDFVAVVRAGREGTQIVIGECKDQGGEISEEDVRKLTAVANAFDPMWCKAFIVFAKAGEFTKEEIERCAKAQRFEPDHRVILLSARELEPYSAYERADKEFEIPRTAIRLEDMGINTQNIFFKPRPKDTSA